MDWLDYREALGIGFSDHEKSKYFLNKIFIALYLSPTAPVIQITDVEYFEFANMTGTSLTEFLGIGWGYQSIFKILEKNTDSLNHFLPYYIAFINCQKDYPIKKYTREYYAKLLCQMLDESHISYDLKIIEDKYFLFPKGAKELDDALVSQPLEWLKDYPNSKTAFIKALKLYSDADEHNASEIADSFRKALERFFQEFFKSAKTLENLKSEYGAYLKGKGVPSLRNKNNRGDHYVTLIVQVPTNLTAEAKEALRAFDAVAGNTLAKGSEGPAKHEKHKKKGFFNKNQN